MPDLSQHASVQAFFDAPARGKLPVSISNGERYVTALVKVTTAQGTFLARSENPRARALAAIMASSDARRVVAS